MGGAGQLCSSPLHRPRHLLLPPAVIQPGRPPRSLLLLGAVSTVGNVPAGPGASPRVGAVLGVWEAERVSAILELAASSPSLRTKSSPRAELGLPASPPGYDHRGMAPEAVTGSILQPKHLGMSPLGQQPSMANILLAPSPCKPAAEGLWHLG